MKGMVIPVGTLVVGLGIGLVIGRQSKVTEVSDGAQGRAQEEERSTRRPEQRKRVSLGSGTVKIPSELASGQGSAQQWLEFLTAEKPELVWGSEGWKDWQRQVEAASRLIALDQIPELLGSPALNGVGMDAWNFNDLKQALAKRWYEADSEAILAWAYEGENEYVTGDRLLTIVGAAIESNSDHALELHGLVTSEFPTALLQGQFGSASYGVASYLVKERTSDEFWRFYDSLPMNMRHSIGYSAAASIPKGQHIAYYEDLKERNMLEVHSSDAFFSSWVSNDFEGFVQWRDSREELPTKQLAGVYQALLSRTQNAHVREYLQQDLVENEAHISAMLKAAFSNYYQVNQPFIKQLTSIIPDGAEVTAAMVKEPIENAQWGHGYHQMVSVAELVTDSGEGYEALKEGLSSLQVHSNMMDEVDLKILQKQVNQSSFSAEQKQALVSILESKISKE